MRLRQFGFGTGQQVLQVGCNGGQLQPGFTGEVRNAKTAAEVEGFNLQTEMCCLGRQPQGEGVTVLLGLDDRLGIQTLGTGEDLETFKL